MTLAEALAASEEATGPINDVIIIDAESRMIDLPLSESLFGVEGEKDVERKYFRCPKIVGDNIDLSTHQIYVHYATVTTKTGGFDTNKMTGAYHCDDVEIDETGSYITFSWVLSDNALSQPGFVGFAVFAKYNDGEELKTKWKTQPAIGTVAMTVPDGEVIVEKYPDVINQIFTKLAEMEKGNVLDEAVAAAVASYMAANPVEGTADAVKYTAQTLTEEQQTVARENIGAVSVKEVNDVSGTKVSEHNTSEEAHNDIRSLIDALDTRVNAILDSEDVDLDQLSELVTYIKSNRSLIEEVTTNKVNVTDIIDNLTTSISNKPLSAKQGAVLKGLIDKIAVPTRTSQLVNDSTYVTEEFLYNEGYATQIQLNQLSSEKVDQKGWTANKNLVTDANGNVVAENKPTIPTKTSQLVNDSGFLTSNGGSTSENVPSYVITEAENVISRIIENQGTRTFTFGVITDLHYGRGGDTDGVLHCSQALNHIKDRLPLDGVYRLGDNTDGYATSDLENFLGDVMAINKMFDTDLDVQGNHDFHVQHSPLIARLIASNNKNVVWGSRLGGYCYKDYEDFKLRVICINTIETGTDYLRCSVTQYNWFVNTLLDVNNKTNASDWQVLILSHHPLDWWDGTEGYYRFGNILNAYEKGTSWNDGVNLVSCNFANKNKARIIANIHGHIHNLLVSKIVVGNVNNSTTKTNIFRIAIPEACYGSSNGYDSYKESTSYSKEQNSSYDTSFCIGCLDLDAKTIKMICYGAGYDRLLNYVDGTYTPSEPNNPNHEPAEPMQKYTNLIPLATDASGAIYGTNGYRVGGRLGSSGDETTVDGMCCTGYIPFNNGNDVIRIKNVTTTGSKTPYTTWYDSNKTFKSAKGVDWTLQSDGSYIIKPYDVANGFFRVSIGVIDDTSIITVNEEIVD